MRNQSMNRPKSHRVRENHPNASKYDWSDERRIRALAIIVLTKIARSR